MKYLLYVLFLILGGYAGFAYCEYLNDTPIYVTFEQRAGGFPKLSKLHLTQDSTHIDTLYHGGQIYNPITFFTVYKITPKDYRNNYNK